MRILLWIAYVSMLFCINSCTHAGPQIQPLEIRVQEASEYRAYLLAKSSCFEDALNQNTTQQNGILIATIKNFNYDTLHFYLTEYLCDSVPILCPDKIVDYFKKDTSRSIVGGNLIFTGPTKAQVDIVKGDSAIIILSAGNFANNFSNYSESYYPFCAESLKERIELSLMVSRSIEGNIMTTYFRHPSEVVKK